MDWYYSTGGNRYGPIEEDEFILMAKDGRLNTEDLVWNETLGDKWVPAEAIENLIPPPDSPATPEIAVEPPLPVIAGLYHPQSKSQKKGHEFLSGIISILKVLPYLAAVYAFIYGYNHYKDKLPGSGPKKESRQDSRKSRNSSNKQIEEKTYSMTPLAYGKKYIILTHLKATAVTDLNSPKNSGIYLKGLVTNRGDQSVSQVRITARVLESSTDKEKFRKPLNLGEFAMGETKTINRKLCDISPDLIRNSFRSYATLEKVKF